MSKEVLQKEFESLKEDLIQSYDSKGMRASGKWANELEVVVEENRGTLLGLEYSQQLETGRSSGKQPPSSVIEQWIYDKGIDSTIESNISVKSLAYLIARKIGREGWKRENHGGVELITQTITDKRLEEILSSVSDAALIAYSTDIQLLVKELETAA